MSEIVKRGHNAPPYVSLELSEQEARWMYEKLYGLSLDNELAFAEVCGMSSSDPRAKMRAALTARLSCEALNFDAMLDVFEGQQPSIKSSREKIDNFARTQNTRGGLE